MYTKLLHTGAARNPPPGRKHVAWYIAVTKPVLVKRSMLGSWVTSKATERVLPACQGLIGACTIPYHAYELEMSYLFGTLIYMNPYDHEFS